jgi:hypothetical protein
VSARFAWRRGPGARRRVCHLVTYDKWGEMHGTACGRADATYDTTCNLPLGLRLCKRCRAAAATPRREGRA